MNIGLLVLAAVSLVGLIAAIGYGAKLEQQVRELEAQKRRKK